jgi:hypothetical protein
MIDHTESHKQPQFHPHPQYHGLKKQKPLIADVVYPTTAQAHPHSLPLNNHDHTPHGDIHT